MRSIAKVKKKEAKRKYDQERKKRKRIEENHLLDAQVGSEHREKRLKISKENLLRELQECVEIEVPDIGVPHQSAEPQVVEVEEEVENFCWAKWKR